MNIKKIFAVPHFHFDVEWWQPENEYAEDACAIIEKALELLEKYPEFKYTLDQAYAIKPFLEKFPAQKEKLKKLIKEGRIEFVGGTLAAPDENIPYGESLVRQFIHGKRWAKEVLDTDVKVAWEIDEFGHPPQMPQILKKCGFNYFVFARGVKQWESPDFPLQFFWESPDGTKILTHWLAAHYVGFSEGFPGQKVTLEALNMECRERTLHEGVRSRIDSLMFPFGTDFCVPKELWMEFVEKWNEKEDVKILFSRPREYFKQLEKTRSGIPTLHEDFNPILTGCYESRVKIKQLCRKSQNEILGAEKWCTIASLFGNAYPKDSLDRAWENILVNDFHDIICGTGTDKVYKNTLKRYADALKEIYPSKENALNLISQRIRTSTKTKPLLVFNSAAWEREEIIETDAKRLIKVKVPALGYTSVSMEEKSCTAQSDLTVTGEHLENTFFRILIDKKTGWIKSLFDKEEKTNVLNTDTYLGNEIIMEEDAGNLWTVQKTSRNFRFRNAACKTEIIESGPLRAVLKTSCSHKDFTRKQSIILYAHSRRIDFETKINFKGKDRRMKVMFKPSFNGKIFYETPYAVTERPDGHYCAQNFVDISDGNYGLALINNGNPGYEVKDGVLSMTLLRSISVFSPAFVRFIIENFKIIRQKIKKASEIQKKRLNFFEWVLYEYHGLMLKEFASGGGPQSPGGMSIWSHLQPYLKSWKKSDAWEHGEYVFRYALYPHKGDYRNANVPRAAYEFNNALIMHKTTAKAQHAKSLPGKFSFLEVKPENVILTVLKKSQDNNNLIARIYETHGKENDFEFIFFNNIKKCEKVSLDEEHVYETLSVNKNRVCGKIGKWEIISLRIQI